MTEADAGKVEAGSYVDLGAREAAPHWQLPPLRVGYRASEAAQATRRELEVRVVDQSTCEGLLESEVMLGGVRCRVHEPPSARHTMLYLHGGGYELGAPRLRAPIACLLAQKISARVVLPQYRLAPEHPFPAAVHDVASVYEELRSEHGTVLLMGDSAGGGLAAALTVAILRAGVAPPAGLILVSPWLDLTVTAETFTSNAVTDEWFDATRARAFADDYLQGHDPTDPLTSPFFAEHRFPRCLIFVSALEVLLDDTLGFALRLARAGTSLQLVAEGGVQHSFVNLWPDLPESKRALDTIAQFAECVETD